MHNRKYLILSLIATVLAMTVVMLGAYTRLKHAGLGCPDWPTCYGQLTVPQSASAIDKAQQAFPGQTVSAEKAWPEMIHRYFAGTLGLLIISLTAWAIKRKRSVLVPMLLLCCVIFQATLGMWTVTWKLLPQVVMGHLLGGMTIATLLWWLSMSHINFSPADDRLSSGATITLKVCAIFALLIVFAQIFLGGWTSANYASVVCPTFPYCHGSFFPTMDFTKAFNFANPIGANYEGGLLDSTTRVTLQMTHRYGAIITFSYITLFAFILTRVQHSRLRAIGWIVMSLVLLQFMLGIANINTNLALPVAVAHNGVALTLLMGITAVLFQLFRGGSHGPNR